MKTSIKGQVFMVWWAMICFVLWAVSHGQIMHLVPQPSPTLNATQIAAFYVQNSWGIRLGATISAWVGAFQIPLAVVISAQMVRVEKGWSIWSVMQVCGGCLVSLFLLLPAIIWGAAAFTPSRPPEITLMTHELASLFLCTTDQYLPIENIPIIVIALSAPLIQGSPFPRWYGWLTILECIAIEPGAPAFLTKTGPFAWNGLFAFWGVVIMYTVWFFATSFLMLRALRWQSKAGEVEGVGGHGKQPMAAY